MKLTLEQVTDAETIRDVLGEHPVYRSLGENAQLWQGSVIGDGRNRFWKIGDEFAVDYRHNILHLLGNKITSANMVNMDCECIGDKIQFADYSKHSIDIMVRLVDENFQMYDQGLIKPALKIFDFDNFIIFADMAILRAKLAQLSLIDSSDPAFPGKVLEFQEQYREIRQKYMN